MSAIGNVTGNALGALGERLAKSANRELAEENGRAEAAIRGLIDGHVKLAGAQGFAATSRPRGARSDPFRTGPTLPTAGCGVVPIRL